MRIIRHVVPMLFLALVTGVIVVGCANHPVSVNEGKQERMETFIHTGDRKSEPLRGMGVLVGKVTMGPMSPVEGLGASRPPAPVPAAKIVVSRLDGQETKSVVTDDRGVYSISLPPGTYRVTMAPLSGGRFTKDLPATITITEGKETHLDILIDTGIR
ncbi:carboxypeptidase regulatory-like domain-containing protein [bacterium]|nr:MAG: carboxypeptidase regulatory-like domain-containing protein [bacterium]